MEEGNTVLRVLPILTAIVVGAIVWLLQRGPLEHRTFKELLYDR